MSSPAIETSQSSSSEVHRDPWLDNIRVVAIVLVVVGHAVGPGRNHARLALWISDFVYLFHMPLFAIAAGWAGRRAKANFAALGRSSWQLLVPFLIFQTVAIAIVRASGSGARWQYASPTFALWFLLSLFCWRLLLPWFRGSQYAVASAIGIALVVGYLDEVGHTFSLSRTLYFLPAFLVGAAYGDRMPELLAGRPRRVLAAAVLVVAAAVCLAFPETINRGLFLGRDSYARVGLEGIGAAGLRFLAISIGIALALACAAVIPRRSTRLSKLGAYTLYAYLLHVVVRQVLHANDLFPRASSSLGVLIVVGVATLFTLVLMSAPVRFVTRPFVDPLRARTAVARLGSRLRRQREIATA